MGHILAMSDCNKSKNISVHAVRIVIVKKEDSINSSICKKMSSRM